MAVPSPTYSFSFAGCGFLGVYHIGVVECLKQHIPHIVAEAQYAGASAGALVACCLICDVPLDTVTQHVLGLAQEAYQCPLGAFDQGLPINDILYRTLEEVLPPDAHLLCSGRLHVSVSRLQSLNFTDFQNMIRNEIISQFSSRQQLIETLQHSSYIPVFSGTEEPVLDKKITMDGALSNNLPRLSEDTVLICPLAGDTHICPQDDPRRLGTVTVSNNSLHLSLNNCCRLQDCFFVPAPQDFIEYYHAGYTDTLRFLTQHDLIQCAKHRSLPPTLLSRKQGMEEEGRPPADHSEEVCLQCQATATPTNQIQSFALDRQFHRAMEQMQAMGPSRHCATFSRTAVFKMFLFAPLEMMRLIPVLLQLSAAILQGQRAVAEQLLKGQGMRALLEEWVGVVSSRRAMVKMILFRTNTLLLFKLVSVIFRVLGYSVRARWWMWVEERYLQTVRENKERRAQEKAQREAAQVGILTEE